MDQLLYTSIERDLAPTRREGFQTVVYTKPALSKSDIIEIEERLYYPLDLGSTEPKYLFFMIASGRAVTIRIVPVADTDRFGRSGNFLAHAVVCSESEFEAVEYNPFYVLRSFSFADSLDDIVKRGDIASGYIEAASIVQPAPRQTPADILVSGGRDADLSADAMRVFLEEALPGRNSTAVRPGLLLVGGSNAVCRTLEKIFAILPRPVRRHCSFDTMMTARTVQRWPYWASGIPEADSAPCGPAVFDTGSCKFRDAPQSLSSSPFAGWLRHSFRNGAPLPDPYDINAAFTLGEVLSGRDYTETDIDNLTDETCAWFMSSYGKELKGLVHERLKQQLGPRLAGRALLKAHNWIQSEGVLALLHLKRGFPPELVWSWIAESVYTETTPPVPDEMKEIIACHSVNPDSRIQLYLLRWNEDWRALESALAAVGDKESRSYITWAVATLSYIPDCRIVRTAHGRFLRLTLSNRRDDDLQLKGMLGAFLGSPAENVELAENDDSDTDHVSLQGISFLKRLLKRSRSYIVWRIPGGQALGRFAAVQSGLANCAIRHSNRGRRKLI
jgi:hypothetical protein